MIEATENETQLVDELRKNLSDVIIAKNQLETRNLLRFIRARNHSVKNAEVMFRRYFQWREDNDMDNIIDWQYPPEFKRYWPFAVTGFDNLDGPVVILPIGLWDPSKVSPVYNDFVRYCFSSMEAVWRVMQNKSQGEKTFKQFCVVVDLKGLSFRTVTTFDAMHGVLEAVKAFESCYPETLRLGLLINAPYVFEVAWRLVKPFVSEATHSKLRFLGSDEKSWKEELLKFMEPDQFPVRYGGDVPDTSEIVIENGFAKLKGMNSNNEFICSNQMTT